MTGLYVACLVFGVVLVAASAAVGGGDDATPQLGEDAPHPAEIGHAAPWTLALSFRFWTFSAASFGAIGLMVSALGAGALASGSIAALGGLGIGAGVAGLFRWLTRGQVTAPVDPTAWIGQEAKVVLPIRPGETGKVAIQTAAGRDEFPATSRDGSTLEPGATVLVAHIDRGVADVTAMPTGAESAR